MNILVTTDFAALLHVLLEFEIPKRGSNSRERDFELALRMLVAISGGIVSEMVRGKHYIV